eukprot:Hpha_TRINITY_DN14867_c4_g17::TRINITY_DN14867_c4_g17_i1::g.169053::m.169053
MPSPRKAELQVAKKLAAEEDKWKGECEKLQKALDAAREFKETPGEEWQAFAVTPVLTGSGCELELAAAKAALAEAKEQLQAAALAPRREMAGMTQEAQQECTRLQTEMDTVAERRVAAAKEEAKLRAECSVALQKARKEVRKLDSDGKNVGGGLEGTEKELADVRQKVAELQDEKASLATVVRDTGAEVEAAEAELKGLVEKTKEMEARAAEMKKSSPPTSLKKEMEAARKQLQADEQLAQRNQDSVDKGWAREMQRLVSAIQSAEEEADLAESSLAAARKQQEQQASTAGADPLPEYTPPPAPPEVEEAAAAEREAAEAEEKLAACKADLDTARKEEAEVAKKYKEVKGAQSELVAAKDAVAAGVKEAERLQESIAAAKKRAEAAEARMTSDTAAELAAAEDALAKAREADAQEKASAREVAAQRQSERTTAHRALQTRVEEAKKKATAADKEMASLMQETAKLSLPLRQRIKEVATAVEKGKGSLKIAQSSAAARERKITQDTERERKLLENEAARATKLAEDLRAHIARNEDTEKGSELQAKRAVLADKRQEREQRWAAEKEALDKEIAELTAASAKAKELVTAKNDHSLEKRVVELTRRLADAERREKASRDALRAAESTLEKQFQPRLQRLQDRADELKKNTEECAAQQAAIEASVTAPEELEAKLASLETEVGVQKELRSATEGELNKWRQSATKEREASVTAAAAAERKLSAAKGLVEGASRKVEAWQKEAQEAVEERESTVNQTTELEATLRTTMTQIEQRKGESTEASRKAKESKAEGDKLRARRDEKQAQRAQLVLRQRKELESENAALDATKARLTKAKGEVELLKAWVKLKPGLTSTVEELQKQVDANLASAKTQEADADKIRKEEAKGEEAAEAEAKKKRQDLDAKLEAEKEKQKSLQEVKSKEEDKLYGIKKELKGFKDRADHAQSESKRMKENAAKDEAKQTTELGNYTGRKKKLEAEKAGIERWIQQSKEAMQTPPPPQRPAPMGRGAPRMHGGHMQGGHMQGGHMQGG